MTTYNGVDISQAYFDAAVMVDSEIVAQGRFDNDPAGFKTFRNWLNQRPTLYPIWEDDKDYLSAEDIVAALRGMPEFERPMAQVPALAQLL
ncbi:MAG: hypothetical protein L0154_14680 [Chloroflexi bacterium]|nr:hypothetical protein [Chloroflexota bacterium]